jgi:hypothetical protein
MCSLGTGKQSDRRQLNWRRWWSWFDIDALVTQEFHELPPMKATLPISPQDRRRSRWRGRFF